MNYSCRLPEAILGLAQCCRSPLLHPNRVYIVDLHVGDGQEQAGS